MHVLARGDLLQRLRLATGLILFTFAATHFLNHALGLVSLEAMQAMQDWRKAVTRSWPGSVVLLAAFVTHIVLALYKISRRLTWKLPFWEAAQIVSGLSIPLFLLTHVIYNRGAASLAGTDDTYAFELGNIWPGLALEHAALLLFVWVHGCIGMHYWLSLAPWYAQRAADAVCAGRRPAGDARSRASRWRGGRWRRRLRRRARWRSCRLPRARPMQRHRARLATLHDRLQHTFLALLGLALLVPLDPHRAPRRRRQGRVLTYRGGPTGAGAAGADAARDQPHEATCRTPPCAAAARAARPAGWAWRAGLPICAATGRRRSHDARQHHAPPHVRLACQIRPHHAITVTRLVAPPVRQRGRRPAGRPSAGHRAQPGGAVPRHARLHADQRERACPTTWCSFSTGCSRRWARPSSDTTAPSTSIWATA